MVLLFFWPWDIGKQWGYEKIIVHSRLINRVGISTGVIWKIYITVCYEILTDFLWMDYINLLCSPSKNFLWLQGNDDMMVSACCCSCSGYLFISCLSPHDWEGKGIWKEIYQTFQIHWTRHFKLSDGRHFEISSLSI